MRRILLLLCVLVTACSSGHAAGGGELQFVSSFEGGNLYRAGQVSVVQLRGTYRQMGRQYGRLLQSELRDLYDRAITGYFIGKSGYTMNHLKTVAHAVFDVYPQRYKEILYGMAETSGLTREEQIILNGLEWFPKMKTSGSRCSGIAVWGDYTKDGPLLFGRNNDDSSFYRQFARTMVIAVYNPTDSSVPTAIVNYPGVMYAVNGINREGLFLELNSGNFTGFVTNRLSIFTTLFSFLQDFPAIDSLEPAFQSTRTNFASIINVADANKSYSYECPTSDVKRRTEDRPGLLVATNHFVDPSWGIPPPDDAANGLTVTRRNNLLSLAEKYKGAFDISRMKAVLDTTIHDGGATQPEETIYQIIAVPKELTLWIKAPGNFDWQRADLRGLFDR
ncbi:MAG: C45 family autoproteolytic acyltransferase/hydrolase [Nitrospiraceae bacterium]|nr:C45 family autoproteolytic acyltransferase/hydrolase [Nitrospiraceae bacterium]